MVCAAALGPGARAGPQTAMRAAPQTAAASNGFSRQSAYGQNRPQPQLAGMKLGQGSLYQVGEALSLEFFIKSLSWNFNTLSMEKNEFQRLELREVVF